ncbi:hypothetical protein PIB30_067400 [Stylosanthes scabra]|uniref:Uncharacterized protein n=1 Tax=Stylosanthes scabra TaxID=79078 RepID=A0ABU6SN01_9FABA|nr:hypothetical protein [Stylosanthes scabra]
MQTEEQRMLFREAFILFLGKTFFCPTTNSFLSPERHFPLVVDVKNPMQYNWSLQIFTWIKDAIKDFQKKGVNHLSACIDDQEEGEGYNAHEEEQINNERDDQSEEVVIEDEEVLKRWTQIEEELKSQRRTIEIEKKKLTKEQEEEIEATLKDAAECFMNDFDGYDEDIPSFSLGFSQEFKSPTHTPKRSMEEEILDIQPLNEIIPENIQFQQAGNPISIGPTRELTAIEQKKIYNWVMKSSKEDGVQQR